MIFNLTDGKINGKSKQIWEAFMDQENQTPHKRRVRYKGKYPKKFEEKYLRKGFKDKISVIRILDSRGENFKLSKAYAGKVDVINVVTAPEIEMLIIHNENKYKEYKKSRKKPSDFCKEDLRMADVKSYRFVKSYFADPMVLVAAIKNIMRFQKCQKGNIHCWTCYDRGIC